MTQTTLLSMHQQFLRPRCSGVLASMCRQCLSIVATLTALWSASTAPAELVLRYTFDEASGAALDTGLAPAAEGAFVGVATRTNDTPSGAGLALDLSNGNQDYISAGDPAKLNGLTSITLTTWVNLRGNPVNNDRLIEKLSTSGGFGWKFTTPSSGTMSVTNFRFSLFIDSTAATDANANLTVDKVAADQQWVFLAMTYDGTLTAQNGRFYYGSATLPAIQLGTAVTRNSGSINDTPNELRIGSTAASTADRTPPAWFDEVRIYNTALSQSELELVRQETTPTVYSGPPIITSQPQNITVPSGANANFSVSAIGGGLSYQWRVNGVNISGAAADAFAVTNVLPDLPASYSVVVSNTHGVTNSANATLTVNATNMFDTAVMSNLWELLPDDRFYLTASGNAYRSLAYYPLTTNLIVVSRAGGNVVVSLDAATGAEQHFLDTALVSGGTLTINMAGVGEDGAIYAANLTANATNLPYVIYRWPTNDPTATPTVVFNGDPGGTNLPGLRWGDSFTVRGGGTNTQLLISPGNIGGASTNAVVVLRTADGVDFQNAIPPAIIQITNAQTGFASLGLAFGPGTNTFFAKTRDFPLTLVEFDLGSQLGYIKQSYSSSAVPNSVTAIAADPGRNLLAGLAVETPDNARLYSIADLARDPALLDQEAFRQDNANTTAGGTGAAAFGLNRLFVLDSNNGIKAFELNAAHVSPAPFSISAQVETGPVVVLSWLSESGRLYQSWARNTLSDPNWGKVGLPVPGTGAGVTLTNPVIGVGSRFYQVRGQ